MCSPRSAAVAVTAGIAIVTINVPIAASLASPAPMSSREGNGHIGFQVTVHPHRGSVSSSWVGHEYGLGWTSWYPAPDVHWRRHGLRLESEKD
jgi:hypothetical protein